MCAVGNNSRQIDLIPASLPNTIAVAATDNFDVVTDYSNKSYCTDISAPGGSPSAVSHKIYSTLPDNSTFTCYEPATGIDSTYGYMYGTSMATPMVTSAIALVKQNFPSLTFEQVRDRVIGSADDISIKNPGIEVMGKYGSGRLNIYNALTETSHPTIRMHSVDVQGYKSLPMQKTSVPIDLSLKNWWLDCNQVITGTLRCSDPEVVIVNGVST